MKAVQIILNSYLPEELRDYGRDWTSKDVGSVLSEVARKYPDKYEDISFKIQNIGRNAAYTQGETLTLSDMKPLFDKNPYFEQMRQELKILKRADPKNYDKNKMDVYQKYSDILGKLTEQEGKRLGTNLSNSVLSGARGKPAQLKMMVTTPGLYTDYKDDNIPLFIRNSYGEGLRPAEFLAGTFGARKSVISTKVATAKGGDVSKQLANVAAPLVVTRLKSPSDTGIKLGLDDDTIRGRVLARPAAGYDRGTIIDKEVLHALRKEKVKNVIVFSPLTDTTPDGISAEAVGADAYGRLPKIGDSVGVTAANAIGEPITQGALGSKHTAGVNMGKKKTFSGFNVINQLLQTPEQFPNKAAVSEVDGVVERIEDAEQGGKFITVGGERHYVAPGYEIMVKQGDTIERGDQLSDGLVDPSDILRLRGLGEARMYYTNRLSEVLADSGMKPDRRNVEMIARASLDHVKISGDDGIGEYLPDDIVSYTSLASTYTPPADTKRLKLVESRGKFLQKPVLHYTIGTRLTPRVISDLEDAGEQEVYTTDEAPKFDFEMPRLRTASHHNPDWLAKMNTSYIKSNLTDDAIRGRETNIRENASFVPRLSYGVGFGENIHRTGKF
jgi:DNA-directed RNA polymerase subunit beta'